ncbi:MAG: M23 family metallopeptidase [Devosia sp.]|nr:M23 family metallopeptidase [Devosia sp.]
MRATLRGQKPAPKVFSRPAAMSRPGISTGHGIRPALFYGVFTALVATNLLTLVALLMAPDITALLGGQNDTVVSAYEDRIAQLRVEVDRLHSRQFAQAGDINLQLQELTQQQELLLEQHQLVKQLADKAAELGIETAALTHTDSELPAAPIGHTDLGEVAVSVSRMMTDSRLALAALAGSATSATATIVDSLADLGIRPRLPEGLEDGIGGPMLPATGDPGGDSIVDDANEVFLALARLKAARTAIDIAPIHKPMGGLIRTSSTFGNRKDPFTGGRAFHSGIDFPAPKGTTVLSAGYGKVTFVGQRSGYGNLVEVTHGPNLTTRYGHLSAFLVKEGQIVNTGTPIAKVGSTGRSTGPHLHFEVRRKDVAVDPAQYLSVGKRLQQFLGART